MIYSCQCRFLIKVVSIYIENITSTLKIIKMFDHRQTFTMENNVASSGLWQRVILTKIKTYHIWCHWLCQEGCLVPSCKASIGDTAGPHTYQMLMMQTLYVPSDKYGFLQDHKLVPHNLAQVSLFT